MTGVEWKVHDGGGAPDDPFHSPKKARDILRTTAKPGESAQARSANCCNASAKDFMAAS